MNMQHKLLSLIFVLVGCGLVVFGSTLSNLGANIFCSVIGGVLVGYFIAEIMKPIKL